MKTRCILPCAGVGSRMNMNFNESKELLLDNEGKPIIQYSLDLCKTYNIEPLVITRKEKLDLISFCEKQNIEHIIIEPKGEWPNTILMSEDKWYDNNIMILPDTRFNPTSIIKNIKNDLELGCKFSIAIHNVQDSNKWCMINDYKIVEKPSYNVPGFAMGLIGFKETHGRRLFTTLKHRGEYFKLDNCSFQYLEDFRDITRTGIVE